MLLRFYGEGMTTFSPPSDVTLDDLAQRVAADGVDVDRHAVARLARRAAQLGASPVLTTLVVDPHEPKAARQRAFGTLAVVVANAEDKARRTRALAGASAQQRLAWPPRAA